MRGRTTQLKDIRMVHATRTYTNNKRILKDIIVEKDASGNLVEKIVVKIYSWVEFINYNGHEVHWSELIETVDGEVKHTFVYLSSLRPAYNNIVELIDNGRLRFKIENEGFNTQKNLGYGLQHKYSRSSELATKNYYTCLQIGHMINQLFELRIKIKEFLKGRKTLKNLWVFLVGYFSFNDIQEEEITSYMRVKKQVRFE